MFTWCSCCLLPGFTEHYLTNTRACFARAPTASPTKTSPQRQIDFKITMYRFFAYWSHYHHHAIIYTSQFSVIHLLFKQEVTRTERTRWVGGDSIERSERKSEDVKSIWRMWLFSNINKQCMERKPNKNKQRQQQSTSLVLVTTNKKQLHACVLPRTL